MRRGVLHCLLLWSITPWSNASTLEEKLSWGHLSEITPVWGSLPPNTLVAQESGLSLGKVFLTRAQQVTKGEFNKLQKTSDNRLKKILEEDLKGDGLIRGFIDALALLYETISDMLLYPAFSFLFFIMTAILIILIFRLIIKFRRDEPVAVRNLIFLLMLHLLVYADLFLVMYEKRRVLFLFMGFQKDILLVIIAAGLGFWLGRSISRRAFEERNLP